MRRVVLLLLVLVTAFPVFAQETPYEDPGGYFRVIVPAQWIIESDGDFVRLTAPSDAITVDLLVVEALTTEDGIASAWEGAEPNFALEPFRVRDTRPIKGAEQGLTIIYDVTGHPRYDNSIVQAYGYLMNDLVYVWLFRGDANVAYQRASDIQLIMGSFRITTP